MLKGTVFAKALGDYRLQLRFEDGVEGVIDLARRVSFRGVFEPLRDVDYFARVRVDPEPGTVVRPNGADPDPDVLYADVAGAAMPSEYDFRLAGSRDRNSAAYTCFQRLFSPACSHRFFGAHNGHPYSLP